MQSRIRKIVCIIPEGKEKPQTDTGAALQDYIKLKESNHLCSCEHKSFSLTLINHLGI